MSARRLEFHPVSKLFPDLPETDFRALVADIRAHGVRVPILTHGGQILDGRHRYLACRELGITCPAREWTGCDPWLEAQSRNLIRRHLSKEQVYAIRKMAAQQFPELAAPMEQARHTAKLKKAQARGKRRGVKALSRSGDRRRESADVIGEQVGVSGATVKRVERLFREAPELLPKVAAGELSVQKAFRQIHLLKTSPQSQQAPAFAVDAAERRLERMLTAEWQRWPVEHRGRFVTLLEQMAREVSVLRGPASSRAMYAGESRAQGWGVSKRHH